MTLEEIKRLRELMRSSAIADWLNARTQSAKDANALHLYDADATLIIEVAPRLPALLDLAEEGLRARERRDFLAASMAEHEAEIRHAIATESHEGMRTFAEFKADVRSRNQTPPSHGEVEDSGASALARSTHAGAVGLEAPAPLTKGERKYLRRASRDQSLARTVAAGLRERGLLDAVGQITEAGRIVLADYDVERFDRIVKGETDAE